MSNPIDTAVSLWPPDKRGEIRQADIHGTKFNVIYTRAGYARSGDVHPTPQHDMIISGKWEITYRENGKDLKMITGAGEHVVIPPQVAHIFLCLEDSVMIEWWEGEFTYEYDKEYRTRVDEINNRAR